MGSLILALLFLSGLLPLKQCLTYWYLVFAGLTSLECALKLVVVIGVGFSPVFIPF